MTDKLKCANCGNDEFNAVPNDFGWLRLKCTECSYSHDPDEPGDFQ